MKSLKYSDVTPQDLYINRRKFVQALGLTSLASLATPLSAKQNYSTLEKPNTFEEITNYNNFYEFGTSKTDPAKYAHNLTTNPCLLYTSPSPRDYAASRMPSSA